MLITKNWDNIINIDKYKELLNKVNLEYQNNTIYPLKENLFKAFQLTDYDNVKVVILGQDPYHEENEAHGLSFSVPCGIKMPPSLRNIFKELENDLGINHFDNTNLSGWANEGVLLLNSILTVKKSMAASHKDIGWEEFTDDVITKLNKKDTPLVFILWGSFAQSKESLITNNIHLIIKSSHPSPLSAYKGFFYSKPFSQTNNFLIKNKIKPIDWSK